MSGKLKEPVARTIKPEFFLNNDLYNCEMRHGLPMRVAYAGLWTVCDREGRFVWNPQRLKLLVLPYDDVDFEDVLQVLAEEGWVAKYSGLDANGNHIDCGVVPKFKLHQHINNKEVDSVLPEPPEAINIHEIVPRRTRKSEPVLIAKNLVKRSQDAKEPCFDQSMGNHYRMDPGIETPVLVTGSDDFTPVAITFPLSEKNKFISISEGFVKAYEYTYSGIDILQGLKEARQWLVDNPNRRKTLSGMRKYLSNWLANNQNRYRGDRPGAMTARSGVRAAPVVSQSAIGEVERAQQMVEKFRFNFSNKAPANG